MKTLTAKEMKELGMDLREAKIRVLKDWGFSNSEIAIILGCSLSTVNTVINRKKDE